MEERVKANSKDLSARIGKFKPLRILGRGGMATVYLAEMSGASGFQKRVALKVFQRHLSQPEDITRFASEARLGGLLSHPNIVSTLEFGDHEGQLFLAMEFVQGATLEAILSNYCLRHAHIPIDISLQIMIELCRGMEYAHRAKDNSGNPLNLVHRDLKPSNILIDIHGQIKIGDFGIARAESNPDKTLNPGVIKGTLYYLSPEQAWGKLDIDQRSDIFALGIILFELMTGSRLYDGIGAEAVRRQAQDANIEQQLKRIPTDSFSARVLSMLQRALARNPEDRFESCDKMMHELEEVLASSPHRQDLRTWLTKRLQEMDAQSTGNVSLPDVPAKSQRLSSLESMADEQSAISHPVPSVFLLPTVVLTAKPSPHTLAHVTVLPSERPKVSHLLGVVPALGLVASLTLLLVLGLSLGGKESASNDSGKATLTPTRESQAETTAAPQTRPLSVPLLPVSATPRPIPSQTPTTPKPSPRVTPRVELAKPSAGTLFANSIPKSKIFVDGILQDQYPVRDLRLPIGLHRIHFEREDGVTQEYTFELQEGKPVKCITHFRDGEKVCSLKSEGGK